MCIHITMHMPRCIATYVAYYYHNYIILCSVTYLYHRALVYRVNYSNIPMPAYITCICIIICYFIIIFLKQ